jgi:hypothetical protein
VAKTAIVKTPEITFAEKEWRDIPGFPGYQASRDGLIRSFRYHSNGKILTSFPNSRNYWRIGLWRDGGQHLYSLHGLIARTFIGPCPDGLQINHIDGRRENNHTSNLEYVTPQQNKNHAASMGLVARGEKIHGSILTENKVRQIRGLFSGGMIRFRIAKKLGLRFNTVDRVVRRETWAHV